MAATQGLKGGQRLTGFSQCHSLDSRRLRACCSRIVLRCGHGKDMPAATVVSEEVSQGEELFVKYRRAVGICLVNKQGLVFAAQRADSGCETWQMPQGGVDEGEEPQAAAVRELWEETCIRSVSIVTCTDKWLTYDHPVHVKARLPPGWEHLKGQAQKWFLMRFEGSESEINLDTEHKEFSRWRWLPLEQLPTSVVPFKREVYQQVVEAFGPLIREMQAEVQGDKQA